MTGDQERVTAYAQGPADLAEVLPYLFDTYPSDSIVLIALTGPRARFGLAITVPIPEGPESWTPTARTAVRHLVANGDADESLVGVLALLCREPDVGESGAMVASRLAPLHEAIEVACGDHELPLGDSLCVSANHWWSYTRPGSAKGEGIPLRERAPGALVATAVYAGLAPAPRPEEITMAFEPFEGERADTQRRALETAQQHLTIRELAHDGAERVREESNQLLECVLEEFQHGADDVDDDTAARLLTGLQDREVRDRGMQHCEPDELAGAQRLWRRLIQRCVPPYTAYAAPALTLLGWVAWCAGDLATARIATREALVMVPDYTLAQLLGEALRCNFPPEPLRDAIRKERAQRLGEAGDF